MRRHREDRSKYTAARVQTLLADRFTLRTHEEVRRIVDETGLTGDFDIDLTWAPAFELPPDHRTAGDAPSIFTALREQLGLRLEPGKARVPVLVIDSAKPPSED